MPSGFLPSIMKHHEEVMFVFNGSHYGNYVSGSSEKECKEFLYRHENEWQQAAVIDRRITNIKFSLHILSTAESKIHRDDHQAAIDVLSDKLESLQLEFDKVNFCFRCDIDDLCNKEK